MLRVEPLRLESDSSEESACADVLRVAFLELGDRSCADVLRRCMLDLTELSRFDVLRVLVRASSLSAREFDLLLLCIRNSSLRGLRAFSYSIKSRRARPTLSSSSFIRLSVRSIKLSVSCVSTFKDSARVVFLIVGRPCSSKSSLDFRGASVIFRTCILRSLLPPSTFPTLDLTRSANLVLQETNRSSPPRG